MRTTLPNGYIIELVQDTDPEPPEQESILFLDCHNNRNFSPRLPRSANVTESVPLYAYIHSGIALSLHPFSCPWDSGQIGHIHFNPDELGWPAEDITTHLSSWLEAWNQYLSGDVWGYRIYHPSDPDNEVESCWGFYGQDYCKSEAITTANCLSERDQRESVKIDQCFAL